jgi:RNA recognition motif-containing protein
MAKIFVVGLPFEMDEVGLEKLFNLYGEVGWTKIITDKETGKSLGYGYVMFSEKDAANKAIEALNGSSIGDLKITVQIAVNKKKRRNTTSVPQAQGSNFQSLQGKESQPGPPKRKRPRIKL